MRSPPSSSGRSTPESRTLSLVNAGHLPPLLVADRALLPGYHPRFTPGIRQGAGLVAAQLPAPREVGSVLLHRRSYRRPSGAGRLSALRRRPAQETPLALVDTAPRPAGSSSAPTLDGEAIDALMAEIETASGGHFADDVAILLISTKDRSRGARRRARQSVC